MSQTSRDRLALGIAILFLWQLSTAWLKLLDPQLFPQPQQVLNLLVEDRQVFLQSLGSSLKLLFWGYFLAVILAVPLGLIVGWNRRLRLAIEPVTNVLGPIPPIVYIPYAIAILPTFTQSSVFIIFIGAFWPLFMNTIAGVEALEKGIVDSARTIGVGRKSMLINILLPGAMPHIVSGGVISMVLAFILLTAAEMIGATSGLGWYVKYFSDFADYPRVVAGIIVIGAVVLSLMTLYRRFTGYLLRWRK
ncbi:ABC-type nitrate/sulfonate/bicarbonate transport system, permease component [uncultured Sporomusa sp.]|jgi:NitT/TauT family transport system permease protein|uniref:ABC-type nitrate/sulfonate/bicarbonate transport system, permease component n=1 Tax=uncultured Sporomusa sp. TaxID=307249 RepID=A0A212LUI2_9FIRM|nr:ABC transporter permease [uncultured Sporomusa sp.]SCM81265.1 ABC-type nitrate/sulfonate/bicarbonate transport system, permease component [uncultured Sporomusa sp.]